MTKANDVTPKNSAHVVMGKVAATIAVFVVAAISGYFEQFALALLCMCTLGAFGMMATLISLHHGASNRASMVWGVIISLLIAALIAAMVYAASNGKPFL